MKGLIFLNILLLALTVKSQNFKIKVKSDNDTIDYFNINNKKGYHIDQILKNNKKINIVCFDHLQFKPNPDSLYVSYVNRYIGTKLLQTDTLMTIAWYSIDGLSCVSKSCETHGIIHFGKIKINKKSNIIVMNKQPCLKDKSNALYKFKVLKFSEYEVILKDLQKTNENKVYYFIKN